MGPYFTGVLREAMGSTDLPYKTKKTEGQFIFSFKTKIPYIAFLLILEHM